MSTTRVTPLTHYLVRRIAMHAHLPELELSAAVRAPSRALSHDRQLARLLAARRWDRVADAAARRARLLRQG